MAKSSKRLFQSIIAFLLLYGISTPSLLVRAEGEECGKQANNTLCPLNVCCSQWGFCGVARDFCDVAQNCQSNCKYNTAPSRPWGYDVRNTVIGYYETWAAGRSSCGKSTASQIPLGSLSHINTAFAYIRPGDFAIYPIDGINFEYFKAVSNLKTQSPGTKIWLSLGGWTFSDNDTATQPVWGDLASTPEKQKLFVAQLDRFMTQWGFDGVDLDWEYPGAPDRRGNPADTRNFVSLVQLIKAYFTYKGLGWGLSFTAPASYWYMKWFDIGRMAAAVDFVNLMTYDMHGSWDDRSNWIGPYVYTHTNMTEIKQGLDLLWRNGVPADKVNMGLAFYGRTYQLADANCATPGCKFKGPGGPGPCTNTAGYLSYKEIKYLIKANKLNPYYDKETMSKYVRYSDDSWLSFDDPESIKAKVDYANSIGLRGLFIWAVNQDTEDNEMLAAVMGDKGLGYFDDNGDNSQYTSYSSSCKFTECEGSCGPGQIATTSVLCGPNIDSKKRRTLCCPLDATPDPDFCTWRTDSLTGFLCTPNKCSANEIAIISDKYYLNGNGGDEACLSGEASYCCKTVEVGEKVCQWKPDTCVTVSNGKLPDDACGNGLKPVTYRQGSCDGKTKYQPFCCDDKVDVNKLACHWVRDDGGPFSPCDFGTCGQAEANLGTHERGGGIDTCYAVIPAPCPKPGACPPSIVLNQNAFEIPPTLCCNGAALRVDVKLLPVPLENLFFAEDLRALPAGSTPVYDIKTDPTMGGTRGSDSSGDPDSTSFAWHIIDGPDSEVSSLDKRDGSHWEVYNCDAEIHDGIQKAHVYCTDDSKDSNCGKIWLGGVASTVIKMPQGCGPGKYAMAISLEKRSDLRPPDHIVAYNRRRGARNPAVYELTFDYDFSVLQKRASNVLLRIDYSDNPGYWNEIVASSAKKKRELHEVQAEVDELHGGDWHDYLDHHYYLDRRATPDHELHLLHERWFSVTLDNWISKMKKVETSYTALRHRVFDNFPITVFDDERVCRYRGVTQTLRASLKANLRIEMETSAQLTIMGNLGDLSSFKQSHLTLRNKGKVGVQVDFQVFGELRFGSLNNELAGFAPIGASVVIPGIVTLGPQFKLLGGLFGKLEVHANAQYTVTLAEWDFAQSYPYKTDNPYDSDDLGIQNNGKGSAGEGVSNATLGQKFTWDAGASGSVELHLTPQVTFGVIWAPKLRVPNAGIDFGVHTWGKVYGELGASSSSEVSYCYGIDAGYEVYVRAVAPTLFPGFPNLNRFWSIIKEEVPVLKSSSNCGKAQSKRSAWDDQLLLETSNYHLPRDRLEPRLGLEETIDYNIFDKQ